METSELCLLKAEVLSSSVWQSKMLFLAMHLDVFMHFGAFFYFDAFLFFMHFDVVVVVAFIEVAIILLNSKRFFTCDILIMKIYS